MTLTHGAGPEPTRAEPKLQFLGHAAFMVTTPGRVRLVIDPFQNPRRGRNWFRKRFPRIKATIVVSTHDHFDHNATSAVGGVPANLKTESSIKVNDLHVELIRDQHAATTHRPAGAGAEMPNHIAVVESHGVRLCHAGDNRAEIAPAALESLGRVDVLAIPVDDSTHLLTLQESHRMIELLNPRVVVPMHYYIDGLTSAASTLSGIDGWLSSFGPDVPVRFLGRSEFALSVGTLPAAGKREVWVLEAILARTSRRA